MKYARVNVNGRIIPAAVDGDGSYRDISGFIDDISPEVIASGEMPFLTNNQLFKLPIIKQFKIEPCIASVPNFYCIGLNYRKDDAPANMVESDKIVITSKATTAINGANGDIVIPIDSKKTDWEVELGVVISRAAWRVDYEDALDYVFGYCVVNDICERDYMFEHGGQWIKGKSLPGYGPIGPWLVTKDEIRDPQNLAIWLKVNGDLKQDSNTKLMISGVQKIVSHMSHYMELIPGDLVSTGTPAGIGMHRKPAEFLKCGDRLELSVEGLGVQRNVVTYAN